MDKVKNTISSLVEMLGVVDATIDVISDDKVLKIIIVSPDESSLIGHDNEKFEALTHLVKRMLAKEIGEEIRIIIDVNGMQAKKDELLKAKASIIADRARAFKIDVEMDPMSSYERMIIHSHLEHSPNIKTESIGIGRERRLVVKYIN